MFINEPINCSFSCCIFAWKQLKKEKLKNVNFFSGIVLIEQLFRLFGKNGLKPGLYEGPYRALVICKILYISNIIFSVVRSARYGRGIKRNRQALEGDFSTKGNYLRCAISRRRSGSFRFA